MNEMTQAEQNAAATNQEITGTDRFNTGKFGMLPGVSEHAKPEYDAKQH